MLMSEFFDFSYWWIFPLVMMAMCFFMMRRRRGAMMCGFGSRHQGRSSDQDGHAIDPSDSPMDILDKRFAYDLLQFFGLRQLRTGSSHRVLTKMGHLDTTGILEITRHPWYLGAILLIWTKNFDAAALVTNVILTVYLIVGTILEERKMLIEFGDDYRQYQKKVSMLVPVNWVISATRCVFFSAKLR